jgi:hypothetical protein
LNAFRAAHARAIAGLPLVPDRCAVADSPERRLSDAVDRIAGQRNSAWSGLYWYTHMDEARRAAQRERKPILSLRLLGKLTDELSCANSRFFRTTLYVDPQIGDLLRREFVCHWQSVRPAPKITIDFGDGRRLERTITGNSVHYVLDSNCRVVDGLPGLYSPQAFLAELGRIAEVVRRAGKQEQSSRAGFYAVNHRHCADFLARALRSDASVSAGPQAIGPGVFSADLDIPFPKSSLESQSIRAVTKASLPDTPSREALSLDPLGPRASSSELNTSTSLEAATLNRLAAEVEKEFKLSGNAEQLIRAKLAGIPANLLSGAREAVEAEAVKRLVRGIALDTVRSEYDFHRRLHEWLSNEPAPDVERLNERVYAELFQAPNSDPWMGLFDPATFSAIDGGGILVDP